MKTMKSKKDNWICWMRDKGTFGIPHLFKKTEAGMDITVCGMVYDSTTLKEINPSVADIIKCEDCKNGKYNDTDLRSAVVTK